MFKRNSLYPSPETGPRILPARPLSVLLNPYTAGLSPAALGNMLHLAFRRTWGGALDCGEIGLPIAGTGLSLPCGIYGRWIAD